MYRNYSTKPSSHKSYKMHVFDDNINTLGHDFRPSHRDLMKRTTSRVSWPRITYYSNGVTETFKLVQNTWIFEPMFVRTEALPN